MSSSSGPQGGKRSVERAAGSHEAVADLLAVGPVRGRGGGAAPAAIAGHRSAPAAGEAAMPGVLHK
eukprot:9878901-Alexandrium_andersonii.AAC.1